MNVHKINGNDPNEIMQNLSASVQTKNRGKKSILTSWSTRYEQLKLYKLQYGNCNVPRNWPNNRKLGQWVQSQRNHYRYWKRGKGKTSMTKERFDALDKLGFTWSFQSHSASKTWSERFEELKAYAKKYGHCDTPHRWPQNPSLGQWVSTQRAEHAKLKMQKCSTMTEDRKKALEDIGFKWSLRKRRPRKVFQNRIGQDKCEKISYNIPESKSRRHAVNMDYLQSLKTTSSHGHMQIQYPPTNNISNRNEDDANIYKDQRGRFFSDMPHIFDDSSNSLHPSPLMNIQSPPSITSSNVNKDDANIFEAQIETFFSDVPQFFEETSNTFHSLPTSVISFEEESFLSEINQRDSESYDVTIPEGNGNILTASCPLSGMNMSTFDSDDLSQISFDEDFIEVLELFLSQNRNE